MSSSPFSPVIEITRGKILESIHYGAIAVVAPQGNLVASYGDPNHFSYLRSSAKPIQALPLIESGGQKHYEFTPQEIALICSSHSGTDAHSKVARSIQSKVGITEKDLLCGLHRPYHTETSHRMLRDDEPLTENRHDCSGKHSGMLALAKMNNFPLDSYLDPEHGVQQLILNTFSEMTGVKVDEIGIGIDGCTAPNFSVPLQNAAWAWAKLVDPSDLAPSRAQACHTITQAMIAHPDMVAWTDRFDTALMMASNGKIVSKGGAEGYLGIGLLAGAISLGSPALGIAIKIADGDLKNRARPAVALEVLRQLGALSPSIFQALKDYGPISDVLNWRKLVV
ncbi:MAG: asparaginase, partial [Chloroflexota bacterium]